MATQTEKKLLSLSEVCERTKRCRATIFRMRQAKFFPAPAALSKYSPSRTVGALFWNAEDVDGWIEKNGARPGKRR